MIETQKEPKQQQQQQQQQQQLKFSLRSSIRKLPSKKVREGKPYKVF